MTKSSEAKAETTIVRPSGFTQPSICHGCPAPARRQTKTQAPDHHHRGLGPRADPRHVPLSRLKPAVPSVDRSTVWIDTVKRGPMVRQVRGLGTLVPEDIRWIAANTEGRVEKIVVLARHASEAGHGYFGIDQPGARTDGRRRGIEGESGGSGADHLARDACSASCSTRNRSRRGFIPSTSRPRWSGRPTISWPRTASSPISFTRHRR